MPMQSERETICAVATAPGTGAIGGIRISGPEAVSISARLCPRLTLKARHLQWAEAFEEGERLDEVTVAWMPGPRSYTGEDVVELFAHGGELNMERLLRRCVTLGARLAEPGEFTRRAFVNGRMDLTQAEAVASVISARSTRALRNAQALLGGELGERIAALRGDMLALAADLEACIDFADEVDAPVDAGLIKGAFTSTKKSLGVLLSSYDKRGALGGISVALVGAVNAGKSSLFNALLSRRRALVSEVEGTTRDFLEAEVEWSGLRVMLVDTAGARPMEEMSDLERAGRALGEERVGCCDLRVGLVDATSAPSCWSEALRDNCELLVASKVDALEQEQVVKVVREVSRWGEVPALGVSAQSGAGLEELRAALLSLALPEEGEVETFRITEERQWEALERARGEVMASEAAFERGLPPEVVVEPLRGALRVLGEVTGEEYSEGVLNLVFSRFCVGK
ncbi:MAG: tRNA uridine-5-carboxymethylaminomethyl(34) synthesis GTPase MnmE [Deltaproteobacteria bacterium]|nr:tRNA uridine-5-carboxymethylaminomethyl(34) synthesis GTPase MnmE [Deltaproteobacteria bacterium]